MFGFLKRETQTQPNEAKHSKVCYLGKLPACPDFIKYQVVQRETIGFDHWLQDAYALFSRQQAELQTEKREPMRKIGFALTGSEDTFSLAGIMSGSQDKSGRHYPFAILASLPEPSLRKHGVNLLQGSWQFIQDISELWGAPWMQTNLQLLNQQLLDVELRLRGMEMAIDVNHVLFALREVSIDELFNRMQVYNDDRVKLVESLSAVLRGISHRGTRRTHFGIRLPLGEKVDFQLMVFWIFLVTSLIREPNWKPQLFWTFPDNQSPAELNIFFKQVAPSYFSHINSSHPYVDYITDIVKISKSVKQISDLSLDIVNNSHRNALDAARMWGKEV
jgi:type VI secretion system ImpM family protein